MTLHDLRDQIDALDEELVSLILKRFSCALSIAEIKSQENLPILNQARENEVLEKILSCSGSYQDEMKLLFSTIMDISRSIQQQAVAVNQPAFDTISMAGTKLPLLKETDKIACQGVFGSFSSEAAGFLFPGSTPVFYQTFEDVFDSVENGQAMFGVVPIENSSAGSVSEVYDLLLKYRFFIVGAADIKIHHCLVCCQNSSLAEIKEVHSHPQALSQCSSFLKKHRLTSIPDSNTAAAAKKINELQNPQKAAICSKDAAKKYGLKILLTNIQNQTNNCTRFIAISREPFAGKSANKISVCFSLPHKAGSLYKILSRFASIGLNLTKIESRPIPEKSFEYFFYVDFSGNLNSARTVQLIRSLSAEIPNFSFLGNYTESIYK